MIYYIGIFILFLVTRLFPYFFSSVPTGYDAGLYLYLFKHAPQIPNWLASSYYSILFFILTPVTKVINDPTVLLIPLQILSAIFLFFSLDWSIKTLMNKNQRLFTLFLFTCSAIQYRVYWFYYVKNIIALAFLLLLLGFIQRKKLIWATITGLLVGLFHLATFLFVFLIMIYRLIFQNKKKESLLILGVSTIGAIIFNLPVLNISILPYLKAIIFSNRINNLLSSTTNWGGTFYDLKVSIFLMLIYLVLPVYFFYKNREEFKVFRQSAFFPALVVSAIIVFGQFFFFRRFIPVFDLFVIITAGYSVSLIKSMRLFYLTTILLFSFFFIFKTSSPLKQNKELKEIQTVKLPAKSYILSTSKEDTAWLMGYTDNKIIAWDFGPESSRLSQNQWQEFYQTSDQMTYIKLLEKLPKPLCIYISNKYQWNFINLTALPTVKKISNSFYCY